MENFKRKIKFKNKGILISVIILLIFLAVAECQQLGRRRSFYPRQRIVVQRTRIQRRPQLEGARDSSLSNRRFNTQRRRNTNNVNQRANRQRERLNYRRQQRERGMIRDGVATINSVHDNRVQIGNNRFVENGGRRISANVNTVQRRNTNVPNFGNRNMNGRRDIRVQNTQIVGRNNNGQNVRTNSRNNVQNSNRLSHRFVRPRVHTFNRQGHQLTSGSNIRNNNYSPNLDRQSSRVWGSPPVQTSTQILALPHFKPLAPNILRQYLVQHQVPNTPVRLSIHSSIHSTSPDLIVSRQAKPTSQSFLQQPIVSRKNTRFGNQINDQTFDVNTLALREQSSHVNPTHSTFVQSQNFGQADPNVRVLVALPSAVPQHRVVSQPSQNVSRIELTGGGTVLRLAPAAPHVAPTVASVEPVVALPSSLRQPNLGLSLGTGVQGGAASGNTVPIQGAPNTIQRNSPVNSWIHNFLLGGEQPDSPDPTDATKTVTELVSLLTSTTLGGSAAEEEEEEIEWEDRPPTTTTTTTTPVPTTQAPTPSAASVIKSIAQRIVSLLVQRGKAEVSPDIPRNNHRTLVFVPPTSATIASPGGSAIAHKGSVILIQGSGGDTSDSILTAAQRNAAQASVKLEHSVIPKVLTNSFTNVISSKLAPSPTVANIRHIVPSEGMTSAGGEILNLNDVIMSDTLPKTGINNGIEGVVLTPYMSSNDLGGLSVKKIPVPARQQTSLGAKTSLKDSANTVLLNQDTSADTAAMGLLSKLKALVATRSNPTGNTAAVSNVELVHNSDLSGLPVASSQSQTILGTRKDSLEFGVPIAENQDVTSNKAAKDLLVSLKSLVSPTEIPAVGNGDIDVISLSPFVSKTDLGGIIVQKISSPSETKGTQDTSNTPAGTGIPVGSNVAATSQTAGVDLVATIKRLIEHKGSQSVINDEANKRDIISISPYLSSNDLGGLRAKKISSPSKEPGPQGTSRASADFSNSLSSKQDATIDTSAMDLLAKIKRLVSLQGNPTTTTKPPPLTTLPKAASAHNAASSTDTCTPRSPNFRCKGKDLFLTMESIGAWCLGMCLQKGCIQTVCNCGCDIAPPNPPPSARSLTDAQRRMLRVFGPPPWARTTNHPVTTDEPPEADEWEPEDGTTTKAPVSTVNPWWAAKLEFSGTSPSPHKDFHLNPIDQHLSHAKKIDNHVSAINEVAWATELKSRLSKLASNADNSADTNAIAGWNSSVHASPPTDSIAGGKAPPNWQGTEWHLPTPPPKKPPEKQESVAGWPGSSPPDSPWQLRPLRDKWGGRERFTGNGASGSSESVNMWNMPMPVNPWGNAFGGGDGIDRRLSRFRFNWGGGSGSGGEEQEAND